jgi:hypothetical protein
VFGPQNAMRESVTVEEIVMKSYTRMLTPILFGLFLFALNAPGLSAQITNEIRAHIDHSFVIGNTTLPPGEYTFRLMQNSELSLMTASSENDKTNVDFIVRAAIDDHTPAHTELTFRKYGNTEFLSKIFENGSKTGVEVTETSREESHLVKEGQQPTLHTEEK